MMPVISIDDEFLKTLDIKVTEGRSLSSDFATDETGGFMVNETAVEFFGWRSALEKKLNRSGQEGKIVGIVQDFHFASLHNKIEPLIFYMEPAHYSLLSVKINKRNLAGTVEDIENSWKKIAPAQPFEFFFLDENFDKLYRSEQKFGQIIGAFAFLAIMIACLGLFGLAAFAAERRTKEIGIRKVLGASVSGMVNLLSKDFIKLVLVANLVAWPIAWLVMNKWLQEFSYRIEIGLWTFALAGGMALLIALTTVSTLAIRAAKANPVESLRYE